MMLTNFDRLQRIGDAAMKRVIKKLLLIAMVTVSVCVPEFVSATHLIGGDLRYRCLGNSQYEISLIYRRDCNLGVSGTEFENPARIWVFDLTTNQLLQEFGQNGVITIPRSPIDTANQILINDCTLAPNELCIEQTVYRRTIGLPFRAGGYRLVYQRCCRNSSLQNVADPLNTGMTLQAILSGEAQMVCNNSPDFGQYPPIFICVNKELNFQFQATDLDGDSLVYELFTPFLGASDDDALPAFPDFPPYDTVVWAGSYSLNDLLGGVPLTIDRFTGFMTGTPNNIGQFLVGVKVLSYRNGVLIETTTREWQFNVRACLDPPTAIIDTENLLNCDGLTINFTESSLSAQDFLWIFNFGDPNSMTSTDTSPSFTYSEPGFYEVALLVNVSDSLCFDTAFATVGVFLSDLTAGFELDVPSCDEEIVIDVFDQSDDPDPDYDVTSWLYTLTGVDPTQTSTLQNPQFILDGSVTGLNLSLVATSSNGCTASYDTTFDVNIISIGFKGDTVGVCDGDSVLLFDEPGNSAFTYTWSPTENLDLTEPNNPSAFPNMTTWYYVTVSDGLCEVSDSVVVVVQDLPILKFTLDTDCRSLVLTTTNMSDGFNYFWEFGDGNTSTEESPIHTYDDEGVYQVTLSSGDGCDVSLSKLITVSNITDTIEDVSISCFAEPVTLNPDASPDYFYMWSPGQFLSDSSIGSPVASVTVTTVFSVTITDLEFPGCSVMEEVQVLVPPDFEFGAPSDSAYCDGPPVALSGSNPDLDYAWLNLDGDTLFEGQVFIIAPQTETSYIVVGTDSFGCSKEDTITLSPTFFNLTLDTGPDTVICFGDSVMLEVTNNDPSQDLMYLWEPADLVISGQGTPTPLVSSDRDTTFTVQITNDDLGCVTTESIRVRVSRFRFEYSPAVLTCLNTPIDLNIGNFDTTNLMFMWSPVEFIEPGEETSSSPTVTPPETTVFTVTITDDYGCMAIADVTVTVSWFDPADLEIFVNQDTIILGDTIFHLYTNQDPSLDFQWEGEGIIPPSDAPEIYANPSTEGVYTYMVTVMNPDGCKLIGQTQGLTVLDPLCNEETVFIPDAFSPNDDGENDQLEVYSNFIESMELRIYNRWGEEVFVSFDQNTKWDGTFRGKELAPDVFGYYLRVVCIPDKPYFRKGNITLFK